MAPIAFNTVDQIVTLAGALSGCIVSFVIV